jgi:hypothetical protein
MAVELDVAHEGEVGDGILPVPGPPGDRPLEALTLRISDILRPEAEALTDRGPRRKGGNYPGLPTQNPEEPLLLRPRRADARVVAGDGPLEPLPLPQADPLPDDGAVQDGPARDARPRLDRDEVPEPRGRVDSGVGGDPTPGGGKDAGGTGSREGAGVPEDAGGEPAEQHSDDGREVVLGSADMAEEARGEDGAQGLSVAQGGEETVPDEVGRGTGGLEPIEQARLDDGGARVDVRAGPRGGRGVPAHVGEDGPVRIHREASEDLEGGRGGEEQGREAAATAVRLVRAEENAQVLPEDDVGVADEQGGAAEEGARVEEAPSGPEEALLAERRDAEAAVGEGGERALDVLREVVEVDADLGDPRRADRGEVEVEGGDPRDGEKDLGTEVGEGPGAGPETRGEQESLGPIAPHPAKAACPAARIAWRGASSRRQPRRQTASSRAFGT